MGSTCGLIARRPTMLRDEVRAVHSHDDSTGLCGADMPRRLQFPRGTVENNGTLARFGCFPAIDDASSFELPIDAGPRIQIKSRNVTTLESVRAPRCT